MSFAYNEDGIRTSKTVNGVTTTYYVNLSATATAMVCWCITVAKQTMKVAKEIMPIK